MGDTGTAGTHRPVIVIVGAGSGAGTPVARRFAAEGYAVRLLARDGERLEAMADQRDQQAGQVQRGRSWRRAR